LRAIVASFTDEAVPKIWRGNKRKMPPLSAAYR
jgi:hypothetical protein